MAEFTRRRFITTSAIGAGVVAGAGVAMRDVVAQAQSGCSITSNFNGTPIPAGDYIWFNSVVHVHGLAQQSPTTIGFAGSLILFTANGTPVMVTVPSAVVQFLPGLVLATTDSVNMQWVTRVPTSGLAGNVFLDGAAFLVPAGGLPGGIHDVIWSGMFCSSVPGITIQWQWAAAVYRNAGFLANGLEGLGVKPVDDNQASAYKNSDHAGTPENFKSYVVGGATGGGGSNFTGSYSGTASCVATVTAGCGNMGGSGNIGGS